MSLADALQPSNRPAVASILVFLHAGELSLFAIELAGTIIMVHAATALLLQSERRPQVSCACGCLALLLDPRSVMGLMLVPSWPIHSVPENRASLMRLLLDVVTTVAE